MEIRPHVRLDALAFGPTEPEVTDYLSFESYCFDNNWVELQFAFGTLNSIGFGVLYDTDEQPRWPGAH